MPSYREEDLNFVLIPLLCPGHILPMMDMARSLAQRGVRVTVITTSHNAVRFGTAVERASASGLSIRLLQLPFPFQEVGLPERCENVDALPSFNSLTKLFAGINMLQEPVEKMIEEMKPAPSCLISDKYMTWTVETARKFQILRIAFDGMSCFSQLCFNNLYTSKVHETVSDGNQPFVVPNLPDRIEFSRFQLPEIFNPSSPMQMSEIREQVRVADREAYGVIINSFEELEKKYVDKYREIKGGKVWCVGPLSLCNKNELEKSQRGSEILGKRDTELKWLDSCKHVTVIYACLGSLSRLTPPQFIELALALEASNYPFILVMTSKGGKVEELEKWVSENRFEERTKGRSLLIRDWAPQVLILSHPAIGAFLTHCGWNSTIEGISAGVPLITWPLFAEQFLNEKFIVQILGIGVSVGAKTVRHLEDEEESGTIQVRRNEIQKAIVRVMNNEEREANERRKRAKEFAEMAKNATEKGGSSDLNVALLIQDIVREQISRHV